MVCGVIGGWSCDPDSWSSTLQILVAYFANGGGTPIYRTVTADQNRPDLVTAGVCGGTALHGYAYDHDTPEGFSGQNYFPDEMDRRTFYKPKGEGSEGRIKERLDRWAAMRAAKD